MNAKQFLQEVLPSEGVYCLARPIKLTDGRTVFKHFTTESVTELVVTARTWDRQGHDVYYAMASLKEARVWDPSKGPEGGWRYRTKANIHKLRTVFLELDVLRPGEAEAASEEERARKYTDRGEALSATKLFCQQIGWPLPMVVDSGWGFHLYWLLEDEIEPGKYEVLAKKLKVIAKRLHYKLDMACTDMSRVFRVVGTHNQKDQTQPQRVAVKKEFGPGRVPFQQLTDAVDAFIAEHNIATDRITERRPLPDYLNFGASNTSDFPDEPLDLDRIRSKCGAIDEFVNADAEVSYHFWMHSLQLLRFCAGERELCHEISSKAESYDEGTTDKILDSFEEKDIPPPLCDTLANDSGACGSCPYREKIRSPAALGREAQSFKHNAALTMQAATGTMPPAPWPFRMQPGVGVQKEQTDKDGVTTWEPVFDYDMIPVKRVFSEREQKEVTIWNTNNPADGFVEIEMPSAALYDKRNFQITLADCGVYCDLSRVDDLRRYMVTYIQEIQRVFTKEIMYSRMGWRNEFQHFIYAGNVYSSTDIRPCEMERGGRVIDAVEQGGTLEGWKQIMAHFNDDAFAAHQFGIGTAFGAILMPFTGISGAIINLVGESGEGKSTVQKVVNSVWGHPTKLMLPAEAKSSTYNAKISFINQMNNLPICAEEITNATQEELGSLAYAITQGSEKWRADIKGSIRESQGGWCTTMLASANSSLHEKLHSAEGASAKALRVLEYRVQHVSVHSKAEFRQGVDMALLEHYGHAGAVYLQYVMQNMDAIKERLRRKMTAIDNTYNMAPEERVWTAAIATNIVGLEIAKELDLHAFNIGGIERFLTSQLAKLRGSVGDMASTPSEQLARFLTENIASMLVVESQGANVFVIQRPSTKLAVRYDVNRHELLIAISALRQWTQDVGASYSKMISELMDQGLLLDRSRRVTLGSGADIPSGQVRVISVDAESPAFSGTLQAVKTLTPNTKVI